VNSNAGKLPLIKCPLNSREFCDGHPMGELKSVETELEDFINHLLTIGMARVIPAG
jgi:hypothetical protein